MRLESSEKSASGHPSLESLRLVESDARDKRPRTRPGPRSGPGGRLILFAGVAAAGVLGAGAGLWARPDLHERQAAAAPPPDVVDAPPATTRKLQIVVDDRPAPVNAPIAVLPAVAPRPASKPLFAWPQLFAPRRAPEGLIRACTAATAVPQRTAQPRETVHPQLLKVVAPVAAAAVAEAFSRADPPKPDAAKARAAKLQLARAEAAKAEAGRAAHRLVLAEAARARAAAVRAQKAEQVRLAAAEARGRAKARQEALADARKRARLAGVEHQLARLIPHKAAVPRKAGAAPVEVADARPAHHRKDSHEALRETRVERASLKSRRAPEPARPAVAHPLRPHPEIAAPQPGSGLMRVSTAPRCARGDPGEAAVCADPGLGAADRQMGRAYQSARAAGVPDAQLRSQQQHWLAARSAAAREAPWAVRDVYMARIAELNGQAKDARDGY